MDFLSALPSHLTNHILGKLPIRDAVRTSILSRDWRYAWTEISCLDFDHCIDVSAHEDTSCHSAYEHTNRLIKIISQTLSRHTGNRIDLFHCVFKAPLHMDDLILSLSKRSIKELLLHICENYKDHYDDEGYGYLLLSSLFACVELTRLELSLCILRPPAANLPDTWFPKLRVLRLRRVASSFGVVDRLIAGCPSLEELTLTDFQGISGLKIRAPNLRDVHIDGDFEWVAFENAPRAVQVSVVLLSIGSAGEMPHPGLKELLGGLLAVERLHLGLSLRFLAAGYLPKQLPILYCGLKSIKLHMDFGDEKETLAALCLLRSSPNLKKLSIMPSSRTFSSEREMDFWQEQENLDFVLHHLRTVKFRLFYRMKVEQMEFMKFVLANSPVLDRMVIKTNKISSEGRTNILKELIHTQKASAEAKIFYLVA